MESLPGTTSASSTPHKGSSSTEELKDDTEVVDMDVQTPDSRESEKEEPSEWFDGDLTVWQSWLALSGEF